MNQTNENVAKEGDIRQKSALSPGLYVVATPIGNLGDITDRAKNVLGNVDLILAEDTRNTYRLLDSLGIRNKCLSLHDHNERDRIEKVQQLLEAEQSLALVSDAGTPLISDPGYQLVSELRKKGMPINTIPGACALVAALSISGIPTDSFIFEGFLPAKSKAKVDRLQGVKGEHRTLVYYESPHRIMETLDAICLVMGEARQVSICRELTKTFETCLQGPVGEVIELMKADSNQQRGEFVVIVQGAPQVRPNKQDVTDEQIRVLSLLLPELGTKKASDLTSKIVGGNRKALYNYCLTQERQQK